jgi:hypothetical protein
VVFLKHCNALFLSVGGLQLKTTKKKAVGNMDISSRSFFRLFAFVFFAISCLVSLSAQTLNFRGIPFGSSPEDVVAKLGEPNEKNTADDYLKKYGAHTNGELIFRYYGGLKVAGYPATVTQLEFAQGKLLLGVYIITLAKKNSEQENTRAYVSAYTDLFDKLGKMYGPRETDKMLGGLGEGPISPLLLLEIAKNAPYETGWYIDGGGVILELINNYETSIWHIELSYLSPEENKKRAENASRQKNDTEGL